MSIEKTDIKNIVETYIQMSRTKLRTVDITDPIYSLSPSYYNFRTFSRSLDSKMGGYIERIAMDLAVKCKVNTTVSGDIGDQKVDLYLVRDGIHYVCEAKTGGNLDNKKAQEERHQLLLRKEILVASGVPSENIKIKLLVPLVTAVLDKMFNTFERDEVIAGNDVWEFVMGSPTDKDYVGKCIHEAMNNLTTKLNSEIMALLTRRLSEIEEPTKTQYTRQLLMLLNETLTGTRDFSILENKSKVTEVLTNLDKHLNTETL